MRFARISVIRTAFGGEGCSGFRSADPGFARRLRGLRADSNHKLKLEVSSKRDDMGRELSLFIGTFTTLLAIINPFEVLPVYLKLLEGKDDAPIGG